MPRGGAVTAPPEQLTDDEHAYLDRLRGSDAALARLATLTDRFTALVRERGGAQLEAWLADVEGEAPPALQQLARRLRADWDAVRVGLTEEWSNGHRRPCQYTQAREMPNVRSGEF